VEKRRACPYLTDSADEARHNGAKQEKIMTEQEKGSNLVRLAIGAGILAAVGVSLAVFVPRRRWQAMGTPLRGLAATPLAVAVTAWAANLWSDVTAPTPPVFDDLRPFDEF
jgi:hypothetical protein